jgi:DNA-binding CsgD family transcriptional regulator
MALQRNTALANLRQLSVLGLPGAMLREALAKAMRGLVPGDLVCFLHHDARYGLLDGWLNFPEMLPDFGRYLSEFHNGREAEAHLTFREFCRRGILIERMHASAEGDYLRSELYQTIYRPYDFRYSIRFALRVAGQTPCTVTVTRGHGTRDYTAEDMRRLLSAAPYLAHALDSAAGTGIERRTAETAEGLLICNGMGKVEYTSAEARALLHDLAEVPMTAATLTDRCLNWATPHLRRMIREATKLAEGRPGEVPALTRSTARGRYLMRVWRLQAGSDTTLSSRLYSVTIRRYIPLALRLLESEAVIALPAREKAICLLLAQGLETKEIAARLGLKVNTAISYIRGLYARLGISGRHMLLERLLPPT